jgi:hypothetical protein
MLTVRSPSVRRRASRSPSMRSVVALIVAVAVATPLSAPRALATSRESGFDIIVTANQRRVTNAPYLYSLRHPEATWVGGDRLGYRCAYMFLQYEGEFVGRVTFTTQDLGSSAYTVINDQYMDEGAYFYDGTPAPPSTTQTGGPGECRAADQAYTALPSSEAGDLSPPLPIIQFKDSSSGALLESRDYTRMHVDTDANDGDANTQPGHTFRIVEATPTKVTVVGYQNLLPVVVIYYELMPGTSTVHMTSNGPLVQTAVTIRLHGSLIASGEVRTTADTAVCEAGRRVVIEHRKRGIWRTAASGTSSERGDYRFLLRDEPGRYRARVIARRIDGLFCARDTSRIAVNADGRGA